MLSLKAEILRHHKQAPMLPKDKPRLVYASVVTQVHGNPWDGLHNGTVCDAITLAEWELRIPAYGCACRKDYMLYKASSPPDFTSPESLWLWGVELHNHVNRKLGKPELTVEQARLQWSRLDGEEIEGERMG